MVNPTNQATSQPPADALSGLIAEGNPNPNPDNLQPTPTDPAIEKRLAETEAANAELQKQVNALKEAKEAEAAKVLLKPEQLGKPYIGEVELLIHPHLGTEVPVKAALVESAIAQGFKRPIGKKK